MSYMPRIRRPTNVTLDPEVLAAVDAWIEAQELPPTRSDVIELALKEFLEKRPLARPQKGTKK